MILNEVKYDNGRGYELTYLCQACEKEIGGVGYGYCPYCGAKLDNDGQPGHLELDEGDICGLIALAVANGGFKPSGIKYIKDGASCAYEYENGSGMIFASWSRKRQMQTRGGAE